ncbi:hypothetical protein [Natrinema longum]|uniref:DUF7998 domain-containing protein n=1 Tax=Natrinema longum TaxID=370324 RepID=A0A8A2UE62_9EURY|nr:hypothetical protein [Natrinema longum]MBZ6496303.1 hypothetical protein [Natrinema longum]QSW86923.1 hypothetical protein J0X27_02790 [Natrinema longum]
MFGTSYWGIRAVARRTMNPFSGGRSTATGDGEGGFDQLTTFEPAHIPEPGSFLEGHDVLEGDDHVAFHEVTQELFEERGVYDATFGYNLARLNLDRRHPDAGYRYAVDADDPTVLRAEFSPTTEFCPQADALVKGSFRAWNGLSDRHAYELVRVRVRSTHHQSEHLNETLERLESQYRESGEVPTESAGSGPGAARQEGDETTVHSPF